MRSVTVATAAARCSMEIRVIRLLIVAMVLVLLAVASIPMSAQRGGGSADDIITIDGTKNPELIPQWSVWRTSFEFLAKDDREQLPTVVVRAITPEQARALMQAAKAATTRFADCSNRVYEREMALWREKPDLDIEAVNTKMTAGHIACRRDILEARDSVLANLDPVGAAALSGFVESKKGGWTTTLKRKYLKTYLLPE